MLYSRTWRAGRTIPLVGKQDEARERVLDLIESLQVGQAIPPERQLCVRLGVPGLTAADLEGKSFYELLEHRYGIVIGYGQQTIEPTVTNEEESADLGVPLHSPALLFERTTSTEAGRMVEFVRSIYRGDRYRLVAELSPQRARTGRYSQPLAQLVVSRNEVG